MVVVLAAVLLPAGDVLRDDQVSGDGDSGAGRWMGQARAKGNRRGWAMMILAADFRG